MLKAALAAFVSVAVFVSGCSSSTGHASKPPPTSPPSPSSTPAVGSAAGYAIAAPVKAPFVSVEAVFIVPKLTCARGENSSAKISVGLDGASFARDTAGHAETGVILACKNGTASYTSYFGIYLRGKNSPDQLWEPPGPDPRYLDLKAGDQVHLEVDREGPNFPPPNAVTFKEDTPRGQGEQSTPGSTPQIQGTSAECFVQAPVDTARFITFAAIEFKGCEASATGLPKDAVDVSKASGSRPYTVTTTSGKVLTRNGHLAPTGGALVNAFSVTRL